METDEDTAAGAEPLLTTERHARSEPVLDRNIQALIARQKTREAEEKFQNRLAGMVTAFAGSIWSVYFHLVVYGGWIAANLELLPFPFEPWDSSLVILAMVASVEAIFLSTFILIHQNRMADSAKERAELHLQMSLLAEHEVTKLLKMVSAIASRMNVPVSSDPEIRDLEKEVEPEVVLEKIKIADSDPSHRS